MPLLEVQESKRMAEQRSYWSPPFSWSSEAGSEKSFYSLRRVLSGVLSWRLFSKSDSSSKNDDDSPPSPKTEAQSLLQRGKEDERWRLPCPCRHSPSRRFRSQSLERLVSHPIRGDKQGWRPPEEALERTGSSTSDLSTTSKHSFAIMDKSQKAKQQFSQFLDEVTFQVLDPRSLEAFRISKVKTSSQAPRHYLESQHSPETAMRQKGTGQDQAGLVTGEDEKSPVVKRERHQRFKCYAANSEPPFLLEDAIVPLGSMESAPEKQTTIFQASSFQGDSKTSLYLPIPSASAADMEKISTLQEQKGELRKRLSYTTHKLEKLETEFDSTRHYLEIELRRAQEELEKVTEKLRRIQNNYLALQRINQELEDKLYRMGQHYEEEKRALSHEIVALNNHLLEAKVTIDKLSEDNELYRKDCNLAAQLLQCSKTYDRSHPVSELPSDFQERVSLHMEKHGCGLPAPLCHPSFADTIPTCVISQVLDKPDPSSLSSHLSNASARDLAFREAAEKASPRTQFKSDIYCSDTALYCPEERRRDRRPSMDTQVKDVGFLRAQHSTESTAEEDGFHSSFSHEAFPEYVASLPTSSSYSSFSVTSEEKEHAQASTLTASQQAIYLNSRDEIFNRQATAAYERPCSPCFATVQAPQHVELGPEGQVTTPFVRTLSPYTGDPFRFPATLEAQQALVAQKLRSESRSTHRSDEELPGRWRPLTVEDISAYSYPEAGRISPHSFPEQYFTGSPGKKADSRASPIYPSYKADSFSEGDDLSQGQLVDSCFLPEDSNMSLNISPGRPPDQLPAYAPSEAGSERLTVQMCGDGRASPAPEGSPRLGGSYANVSPASSAGSLEPSSMEASPEIHLSSKEPGLHPSIHSKQQQFQRTPSTGLSRKDSLTKAQFYGTLLN